MKKFFLLFLLVFGVFATYWTFFSEELPEEDDEIESEWLVLSEQQLQDGGIAFAHIKPEIVEQTLPIYGKVSIIPDNHCHITSRISGIVKKALKNLGDEVHQGETIALIESKELAEAQYHLKMNDAKINHLQSHFEKQAKLSEKNLSTEYELAQAMSELKQAEIERQIIEQKLHLFGITANMPPIYEVKVPFDGTIIKRFITAGEAIDEGKELYEIANLEDVWGEFTVYPQDIHLFDLNKEIIIQHQNTTSKAFISYISPLIDEEQGTIVVLANIENSLGHWRPGSKISGNLIAAKTELPKCLPSQAVVLIDDIPHIFIARDEGIEARKVLLGHEGEFFTEIIDGVDEKEKIVVKNAALLKCELTKQEPD